MASRSFGSAITSLFSPNLFNVVAVALLLTWSLSPLTTQALQRMLRIDTGVLAIEEQVVQYINTAFTEMERLQGSFKPSESTLMPTTFSSTLMTTDVTFNNSFADSLGNPKIPVLDSFKAIYTAGVDGWYSLDSSSTSLQFPLWSSNYGIPLAGLQDNTSRFDSQTSFIFQSSYFAFTCSPWKIYTAEEASKEFLGAYTNCFGGCGLTSPNGSATADTFLGPSFWISPTIGLGSDVPIDQLPPLVFGSVDQSSLLRNHSNYGEWNISTFDYNVTTCNWAREIVDVNVTCTGRNCGVSRIRAPPTPPSTTALSQSYGAQWLLQSFTGLNFPASVTKWQNGHFFDISTLEWWLIGKFPLINGYLGTNEVGGLSTAIFQHRLSLIFNSFHVAYAFREVYAQSKPQKFFAVAFGEQGAIANATATLTKSHLISQCHWGWLVVLLLSCAVSIAATAATAFCRLACMDPMFLAMCRR